MTTKSIVKMVWCGLLSICLSPNQLLAQVPVGTAKSNPSIYEDDRIRVVIQECSRKLQDLVCRAILTSKSSDRAVDLNGSNIKLVDFEGNEYYPSSLRLANRVSENNSIKAELIENVPSKASFVFAKVPVNLTQIALFQIPLSGGINATAKFRNFAVVDPTIVGSKPIKSSVVTTPSVTINTEANSDPNLVCPDRTKILYRAVSKSSLIYICGTKIPTHYVGIAKDSSQGITLRLRYYDKTQFSANDGETNYTIAVDRLTIRKDNKIIYQEKIQVLQALPGTITAVDPPLNSKPKKTPTPSIEPSQNRNSTSQPAPKIKR